MGMYEAVISENEPCIIKTLKNMYLILCLIIIVIFSGNNFNLKLSSVLATFVKVRAGSTKTALKCWRDDENKKKEKKNNSNV